MKPILESAPASYAEEFHVSSSVAPLLSPGTHQAVNGTKTPHQPPPPAHHSKGVIPVLTTRNIRPKTQNDPHHYVDPRTPLFRSSTPSTPSIMGSRFESEGDLCNTVNATSTSQSSIMAELISAAKKLAQEVRAIHELVDSYDRTTVEDAVMVLAQLQHRMERRSLRLVREIELLANNGGGDDTHTPQPSNAIISPTTSRHLSSMYTDKDMMKESHTATTARPPLSAIMLHKTLPSARLADISPVPLHSSSAVNGLSRGSHIYSSSIGDEPRTPCDDVPSLWGFTGSGGGSMEIGSDGEITEYPDPSLSFFQEEFEDEDD
ncbi:Hypothetical protein, putative [Bodo saltans]|uniref:Uncharacterized protein n=1 Tax=Bodo saltans TaxID=75058 RepID=A0A0S4JKF7_BODSA|nr:Hypothetical protein, putative [Bodo saltans]|eukprot:CUG91980.1 Hypothetical protein, putative [Bodo saltans]